MKNSLVFLVSSAFFIFKHVKFHEHINKDILKFSTECEKKLNENSNSVFFFEILLVQKCVHVFLLKKPTYLSRTRSFTEILKNQFSPLRR